MRNRDVPLSGLLGGLLLAPVTATGSFLRRARVFHPRGVLLRGVAVPAEGSSLHHEVGARLAGPVLARFSGAWWKTRDWPDVLGCALRFSDPGSGRSEQDLLLATVRVPLTTLLAPLSTHVDDYLRNDYFGVAPFWVPPLGRVKLRLTPMRTPAADGSRNQRLASAAQRAPVRLQLEMRAAHLGAPYHSVAVLELDEVEATDQEALHFDPFKTGRDVTPTGFVHGLRVASYAASRWARGAA